MKTYNGDITELQPHQKVFVPTNLQGRHGKGFALWAKINTGLKNGIAVGPYDGGYCVPTKDLRKNKHPSVSRIMIMCNIGLFYDHARKYTEFDFLVPYKAGTQLLSGYTPAQMAEMFTCEEIPENVVFEKGFAMLINK